MTARAPSIFVSHAHADRGVAQRMAAELQDAGVDIRRVEALAAPSESWSEQIRETIRTSDIVLVLLSPAAVDSKMVREELDTALLAELNERAVTVVPALIEDCELPPALKDRQVLDLRAHVYEGVRRLAEQLSVASDIDFTRMAPEEFEELVAALVEDLGFDLVSRDPGPDRGYDLRARGPTGDLWLVEAKHYGKARVDLSSVQRLVGASVVHRATGALLVTSGQLTSATRSYIEEIDAKSPFSVRVIDRTTLTAMLLQRPELARRFFDRP
jgi:TIR domain/Restriction endonuclease